ncbi:MAG: anaerobic ribonucleoside-triphosphate reductase activating protein [Marinospirillum sp.]|uniref:anaerobic ribonucleoside-triphosphate reductase activating protein n=1 Tax=Marinospirillum sp. TaxID=2183934 RepID=UPI0019E8402E|nr:anaerobic ribonucleoside-triphosphate reductase activating protein [Marinospirillum sp.]MBE0506452.1 anaerobic ribonucleoside-triphosphate reductase activating protein [Marinospirillum sp.]
MSATAESLVVAGLTPMTTLDYPDHLACVVFTQGCPLRCGYCHNPQMLTSEAPPGAPSWKQVDVFLQSRIGLLQAVVFSGGEPTAQRALLPAVARAAEMGFKIGLHTSGINPVRLAELLPLLGWVGLDIKAEPHNYERVCGRPGVANKVVQSLQLLQQSGCNFEVRCTLHPRDLDIQGIHHLLIWLESQQVQHCALQLARAGQSFDPHYARIDQAFDTRVINNLIAEFQPRFSQLLLR